MENSIEQIRKIIESNDFSSFIGLNEDTVFEAKNKSPYDLSLALDRYELAKDVSSFANEKGGYIVIGLKHEPAKDEKTDVVTELDLMKKEDCQISSYCAVARQYIFPTLNVEANWIEDKNHPGLGIGYLFIPAQSEEKKPFIITRVVEEGEEQKAIIFGIAKRFKSDSIPFAVNQIYDMLQNGKNDVSQKLLRIESKVDKLVSSGKRAQATIPNRILETRIKNLLEKDDKK